MADLSVIKGDKLVNICLKYAVLDVEGLKLFNARVHEKTVDLEAK